LKSKKSKLNKEKIGEIINKKDISGASGNEERRKNRSSFKNKEEGLDTQTKELITTQRKNKRNNPETSTHDIVTSKNK
jgi:hypothetical protein